MGLVRDERRPGTMACRGAKAAQPRYSPLLASQKATASLDALVWSASIARLLVPHLTKVKSHASRKLLDGDLPLARFNLSLRLIFFVVFKSLSFVPPHDVWFSIECHITTSDEYPEAHRHVNGEPNKALAQT